MPFLSEIPLNPLRSGGQSLIRNPQRMHAAVLGGLPAPVTERVLWRLETQGAAAKVLVLTQSQPSWESVVEQAGWPSSPAGAPRVANLEPLLDRVVVGREFAFRARLNPTRSVSQPTDAEGVPRRGQRILYGSASAQLEWFVGSATGADPKWGFAVDGFADVDSPQVRLADRGQLSFVRHRGEPRVTIATATFEGRLRITDAPLARRLLIQGIGRGKAYGCGLLTLAPVGDVVAG